LAVQTLRNSDIIINGQISTKELVMRRIHSIVLLLLTALSLSGASLPSTKPEEVGLSTERLHQIHAMVQRHIDAGDITGAVMFVARKGQIAYLEAQGSMDAGTKKPMTRDSVFRMASMTKPVIGTSIMMMLEEGKLQLGDPVSKYIPEFKDMKVGVLQEPGHGPGNPPKFYTVPAERAITIKDLLTHTSGLSSGPMGQSEVAKVRRKPTETLADYVPRLALTPLEFQPGSHWMYSPSDGFDVLARIVEVASDMPLDRFLKQRIFDPLDMPDTSHYPTDAQMLRLVTAYQKTDNGLVKNENSLSMSSKVYFAGAC
jgi:CubicO group peptidase (beta-lactamase class C family)